MTPLDLWQNYVKISGAVALCTTILEDRLKSNQDTKNEDNFKHEDDLKE